MLYLMKLIFSKSESGTGFYFHDLWDKLSGNATAYFIQIVNSLCFRFTWVPFFIMGYFLKDFTPKKDNNFIWKRQAKLQTEYCSFSPGIHIAVLNIGSL